MLMNGSLAALGAALFEAGSLDRAAAVANETVAAARSTGHEAARWRGEVERVRLFAYRHPESVDPASEFSVAERAASALTALADTVGVARARYLMSELAWLQGRSEAHAALQTGNGPGRAGPAAPGVCGPVARRSCGARWGPAGAGFAGRE
jgi:hypothetical protein